MVRIIALAIGVLALSACGSSGSDSLKSETQTSVERNLVQGQTTRQQVQALYGEPRDKEATESGETWRYNFTRFQVNPESLMPGVSIFISGSSSEIRSLQVSFNKDGILKDYTFTEGTSAYRRGI